jgi:hypothetical protein
MKRFVMAIALSSILSVPALAGDIPSGDFVAPPRPNGPASTSSQGQSTVPGQGAGDTQEAPLDAAQTALLTILSLLLC